ncbi:response regulator [Thermosulfuriphilus ammonigenes]|uniref:Response regulator n=1 Tax=Thermosulfuriphilus ammonigenes TaxID=1936021 RepID=A0A6G7PW98_9BACT|nr:response regulator [Thermosulfuriphilus ammonigenes]MBA2847835.1 CheY-like chemotaxis protein [Thermosulfuriphilus ammonigenes]QIJ71965.1 response regulator [Thermosulfuriphilus ammonigenes]HFB84150.1 response regulator [Thermodesulfatator sp.]
MKIMIVDDDEAVRALMAEIIALSGHEVILAADGLEALQLYRLRKPDVIFMDLEMPRLSGPEAIRAIKAFDQQARIFIITGNRYHPFLAQAARESLVAGTIFKPFSMVDITLCLGRNTAYSELEERLGAVSA